MIQKTLPFLYVQALFQAACWLPMRLLARRNAAGVQVDQRQPPRLSLAQSMMAR